MHKLLTLQKALQNFLLHSDAAIKKLIIGTKKFPIKKRLAIYQNAYQLRLVEALGDNFPKLKQYMGDDEFEKCGLHYLAKFPSNYTSIRWFGAELAVYLQAEYPDSPWLAELAQLEWTMTFSV